VENIKKDEPAWSTACTSNCLPLRYDQPCTGRQWPSCFYLMETQTQNSTISLPSSISSHSQVATTPTPCFLSSSAYMVHPQANPCFAAIPFSLEQAVWRKTQHKLSLETTVTQSLGTTTEILIWQALLNLNPPVVNPEGSAIEILIQETLVACPHTITVRKRTSLLLPLFPSTTQKSRLLPSDWLLYSLGDWITRSHLIMTYSLYSTPPRRAELASTYIQHQAHPQQLFIFFSFYVSSLLICKKELPNLTSLSLKKCVFLYVSCTLHLNFRLWSVHISFYYWSLRVLSKRLWDAAANRCMLFMYYTC
jgi:hypothetical protein